MPSALVTVEPVEARTQLRRFAEVPYVLHHHDPRWRAGVRAWEQWRLDARRHPYFDHGDAAYLLARIGGRPVGRIAAHVARVGDRHGWFGFFDTPDDQRVTRALLEAAQGWLDDEGVRSMVGPVSWTPAEEFGLLSEGFEHTAVTGSPWNPPWYAAHLLAEGLDPGERRELHRIDLAPLAAIATNSEPAADGGGVREMAPAQAGRYLDPRLVLDGVAGVPDVADALQGASLRSAWRVARAAKDRDFDTAVCVRCDGDAEVLVPRLAAAAGAAGYRWLLAPWSTGGGAPERVRQVFSRAW